MLTKPCQITGKNNKEQKEEELIDMSEQNLI